MSSGQQMMAGLQNFSVLSGFTINANITGNFAPVITFNSDGSCTTSDGTNQPWGKPPNSSAGGGYWVNMAVGTGTGVSNGATRGTWISLSSAVTYGINAAVFGSVKTRTGTYSIASDSGGVTVVGSGNYSIQDDNT